MPSSPQVESLRSRLQRALPAAMKARDQVAVAALRSALAAIKNAEAVAPPAAPPLVDGVIPGAVRGLGAGEAVRLDLPESRIVEIVRAEVTDRQAAADDYELAGQVDDAARLRAEADFLTTQLAAPV